MSAYTVLKIFGTICSIQNMPFVSRSSLTPLQQSYLWRTEYGIERAWGFHLGGAFPENGKRAQHNLSKEALMRSNRGAFFTLAVLGGYLLWRNRFAIQQQLEAFGVKTPLFKG